MGPTEGGTMRLLGQETDGIRAPCLPSCIRHPVCTLPSFPGGTSGKESTCQEGDMRDVGLNPRSGRSLGGGNGNHSNILAWKIP